MSKKFTLPHSEAEIKAAERDRDNAQLTLNLASDLLNKMRNENREAQQAEDVRKAQVMTPTILRALERLEKGEFIRASTSMCRIHGKGCFAFDKRILHRLKNGVEVATCPTKDDRYEVLFTGGPLDDFKVEIATANPDELHADAVGFAKSAAISEWR